MKSIRVGHVMKKEQQVVGTVSQRFVEVLNLGRILSDVAGSGGDGSIHADPLMVGTVPLSPAIFFGGLRARVVVIPSDIGQRSDAEGACVVFIDVPGTQLQVVDGLDDQRIAAESQSSPFIDDRFRTEI